MKNSASLSVENVVRSSSLSDSLRRLSVSTRQEYRHQSDSGISHSVSAQCDEQRFDLQTVLISLTAGGSSPESGTRSHHSSCTDCQSADEWISRYEPSSIVHWLAPLLCKLVDECTLVTAAGAVLCGLLTIERASSRDHATSSVTAVLPPQSQRCGTVCLNSFGHHLRTVQTIVENVYVTRNLLTYLLTYLLTVWNNLPCSAMNTNRGRCAVLCDSGAISKCPA